MTNAKLTISDMIFLLSSDVTMATLLNTWKMKWIDWLNLNYSWFFASPQFFPCPKLIFNKKVFGAESACCFPLREICECYENVTSLCISFSLLSVFYRSGDKSSNHHHKNQAPWSTGTLAATSKNVFFFPYFKFTRTHNFTI